MELHDVWKKLEKSKLETASSRSVGVVKQSKHPVQKLKNAYLQSTAFAITFLVGFIVLFFYFPQPIVRIGLALVIASYIFFLVVNFSMYRKIKVDLPVDQSLKDVLKHTHAFISENIRFQKRVSIFIYPIAVSAGFVMGAAASNGNVEVFMQKTLAIVALIGCVLILTPVSYYLAGWMYKVSYGKCLEELQGRIAELDDPQ